MGLLGKRVIYVAKQSLPHLKWAVQQVLGGALIKEGMDYHDKIKKHLKDNNVPHGETDSVDRVPPGHSSYHKDDSGNHTYYDHS